MVVKLILIFCGSNVSEDGVESECFTTISIGLLHFYESK